MQVFSHPDFDGHEQVDFACDRETGLRAILAIHSTVLGPALGGCRVWAYASDQEALADALRLSRGMTYKAALAGLALGGGKSVIMVNDQTKKSPALMRAMGRAVERLGGRYVAAEDVGTTVGDMDEIATQTSHVSGVSGGTGDPSPRTAQGIFLAMQAAAQHRWGTGLSGRTISVTGLGSVGARLCAHLSDAGAHLVVSDVREEAVDRVVRSAGAERVAPVDAHRVGADIFAPCALGAGLSEATIPELAAEIVCGAANNQLATAADGERLRERGCLYAPDYLVNAGGLIAVSQHRLKLSDREINEKIAEIPETLIHVFRLADQQGIGPEVAADRLALDRMAEAA